MKLMTCLCAAALMMTGCESSTPSQITPLPGNVSVVVSATPPTIAAGSSTTFTATVAGATAPITYAWVFGDGSTDTATRPTHVYPNAGTYPVQVTITDAATATATSSTLFFVVGGSAPAPDLAADVTCVTAAHGSTTTCTVAVTFGGVAVPPAQITNVAWDWGDGQMTSDISPSSGHVYVSAGTYTVVATVTATPTGATAPRTATASRILSIL